jgi:membrane protein EpsK
VRRSEARRFGSIAGLLTIGGVADLATYSVDRVILSANRGPAAVTLYEGPLQMQNMIRFLNGVLVQPIVATGRRFFADRDDARLRELFLRGLRYSLAVTMPLVIVAIVLARPILTVWLGPSFEEVATETAVFCSWWLVGVNGGLAGVMLAAGGRFRLISATSWLSGLINLPLALILTPEFGLWGPIIAAMTSFLVSVGIQFPAAVSAVGVTWREVARTAWIPAYSTAAILAIALVACRAVVDVKGLVITGLVAAGGVLGYWLVYAALWFSRDEWGLVKRTLLIRPTVGQPRP